MLFQPVPDASNETLADTAEIGEQACEKHDKDQEEDDNATRKRPQSPETVPVPPKLKPSASEGAGRAPFTSVALVEIGRAQPVVHHPCEGTEDKPDEPAADFKEFLLVDTYDCRKKTANQCSHRGDLDNPANRNSPVFPDYRQDHECAEEKEGDKRAFLSGIRERKPHTKCVIPSASPMENEPDEASHGEEGPRGRVRIFAEHPRKVNERGGKHEHRYRDNPAGCPKPSTPKERNRYETDPKKGWYRPCSSFGCAKYPETRGDA